MHKSTQPEPTLRLAIELVPQPCWHSSLRNAMPRSQWDTLRRQTYAQYEHKCGICGAAGRLNCHERWEYDDQAHVQHLLGFIALCEWCHHVKHLGHAGILARSGKLNMEHVIEHFMRVNECSKADFERCRDEAIAEWRARNRYAWRTDLGEYSHMATLSTRGS
jgi:hypothetical protein